MEKLIKTIGEQTAVMLDNLAKNAAGNKAAGARARKATLELEKLFKQYRKASVEAAK